MESSKTGCPQAAAMQQADPPPAAMPQAGHLPAEGPQPEPSADGSAGPASLVLALTTEADVERAQALARVLVERRLVACVALTPLRSIYRWQGAIETAEEVQLLLKTHASRLVDLESAVRALHSYDTPEWIHWPVAASAAYGRWLAESCGLGEAPLNPGGTPPGP
ncbi:divalent-cation tolerance protein CutA [Synechococcus sp. CCY9201]|nr:MULTISPECIES: divalent-cation tolerance protein CutA [unclassified Synechococcus]MEA5473384.1 divalent-cation tolerance protein CutA [Synechococcus sp. CCY9201]CAK6691895.1 Divalent-cation tolerance protein CutA [Synechococcus sp. CBW1107]